MLSFLGDKISGRKLRLLGCAACRRVWIHLKDQRSRHTVETVEKYADGQASLLDLKNAYDQAVSAFGQLEFLISQAIQSATASVHHLAWPEDFSQSIQRCLACAVSAEVYVASSEVDSGRITAPNWESLVQKREEAAQAKMIRDIVGNPFRPVTFNPSCVTLKVKTLANEIYGELSFSRLPELADALREAGCINKDILSHCRGSGPHWRGCWVLDLLLGKVWGITKHEWTSGANPQPMLEFLRGKTSDRKLRLFAVASCRRIWHLITDERSRRAVEVAERFADNLAKTSELKAVCPKRQNDADPCQKVASGVADRNALISAVITSAATILIASPESSRRVIFDMLERGEEEAVTKLLEQSNKIVRREEAEHCQILRYIFGNPFHPITLDASCLTPTVKALAQSIYDERTFDQMPLLADELEKAGCANEEILDHCQAPSPHVRGCWVVDAVLERW